MFQYLYRIAIGVVVVAALFFSWAVANAHAETPEAAAACEGYLSPSRLQVLMNRYVPVGKNGAEPSAQFLLTSSRGKVEKSIFTQNASRMQAIASTQKMVTAWTVYRRAYRSHKLSMSSRIPFKASYLFFDGQGGRSLDDRGRVITPSLLARESVTVSLKRFLYNLLMISSNGAAMAVADASAGSQENFVALMNQEVKNVLGSASQTYFQNPHGLTDSDSRYRFGRDPSRTQKSSAADLAKFMASIMGDSGFRSFLGDAGLLSLGSGSFTKYGVTQAAGTTVVRSFTLPGLCGARRLIMTVFGRQNGELRSGRNQINDFAELGSEIEGWFL